MRSFSIQTFGCRTNQAEAFQWAGQFQNHGLFFENNPYKSDLVIVNTCTITKRADADVRNFIRKISRKNPCARIIVTGCYAERDPLRFTENPKVWEVFLNNEKDRLLKEVIQKFGNKESVPFRPFRSRAPVKIQDGCDFHCTFCVIPFVRGPSRSRSPEAIVSQVKQLVDKGLKEIVLTGIHLCLYGKDLIPPSSLQDLISALIPVKGLEFIRLSSLDPRFLDEEFMDFLSASEKICPHFHFSLQHTSDRIIRKMGRKISSEQYRNLLNTTRDQNPDASLGADLIVGFPGESKQDFEQLFSFLEDSPLTYFHVFSYSPRPKTLAENKQKIHSRTKKKRSAVLRALSQEKNWEFRKNFRGRVLDAVVVKQQNNELQVLTPNYLKVIVPDSPGNQGDSIKIKITDVAPEQTTGSLFIES
ncbi:MAG: tRNA (N(6)-L-threonylcarbamoyladenosine(37)-C(2))-methylthiotransferase MtaB [Candidatus Aminicenantes bacterium]|nr:tRNA (N(6)-L-threonylcarbamoyladenosine(37)-C(2))-methylthiotransferase MtaB [Candidatus Aminicenantes bacterium]